MVQFKTGSNLVINVLATRLPLLKNWLTNDDPANIMGDPEWSVDFPDVCTFFKYTPKLFFGHLFVCLIICKMHITKMHTVSDTP